MKITYFGFQHRQCRFDVKKILHKRKLGGNSSVLKLHECENISQLVNAKIYRCENLLKWHLCGMNDCVDLFPFQNPVDVHQLMGWSQKVERDTVEKWEKYCRTSRGGKCWLISCFAAPQRAFGDNVDSGFTETQAQSADPALLMKLTPWMHIFVFAFIFVYETSELTSIALAARPLSPVSQERNSS